VDTVAPTKTCEELGGVCDDSCSDAYYLSSIAQYDGTKCTLGKCCVKKPITTPDQCTYFGGTCDASVCGSGKTSIGWCARNEGELCYKTSDTAVVACGTKINGKETSCKSEEMCASIDSSTLGQIDCNAEEICCIVE
jgi:hypothetical protein